MMMIMMFPNMN